MKILYLHQYFKTPDMPGGHRSYYLARHLVENGHKVVMITSNTDNKYWRFVEKRNIDDIEVIYIKNAYSKYMGYKDRIVTFIRFMIFSSLLSLKVRDIDLVFATSTPLTIGVPALIMKWLKGKKYVFEVRDLWPEAPVQIGAISSNLLIKILFWLERIIYNNSEHIMALSPGIQSRIEEKCARGQRISMIPNMSNLENFAPRGKDTEVARRFHIDLSEFNVVHFGSMGEANGLEYIAHAANICQKTGQNDVKFLFVGYGPAERPLLKFCKDNRLTNVRFLGRQPMKLVSEIVNLCDCSVVSFKDLDILETNSPNKFFDSLAAGKPTIVNSAGWTKDLVEKSNCGFYVDPKEPGELVEQIIRLKNDSELLRQMGNNSRDLAQEQFDLRKLADQFVRVLESA